tara:strand:- start:70 stop:294 length:225 start_codon:yes stop_codon:yes gene_type:complete
MHHEESELLYHFLCSIAGLYIWEIFIRAWWFKKWNQFKKLKFLLPKGIKDIPSWFKNVVWVYLQIAFLWLKNKF